MSDEDRRRAAAKFFIESRARRRKHFSAWLFADPAWDILLAIYAAGLDKEMVSITTLAVAAKASRSTVERWLTALVKEGLVRQHLQVLDDRVSLTEKGQRAMDGYFAEILPVLSESDSA